MAIYRDRNWHSGLLGVFSIIGVLAYVVFCCENRAFAQIIPDGTLGDSPSRMISNINIKGSAADRIDGGAIRGTNLFHSFQEFNVGNLQRVYFANPTGIENILTRVTGGNVSKILGTLGVDGSANLFFLNPNGILFGSNARLDVNGSFVAGTANSIVFANGLEFSATNPQTPSPLLTINPSTLFFNQLQAGKIENRSIAPAGDNFFGLRVPDGRSLLLVGGDIAISGGGLNAPGGRVELAGVAGGGTVGLNLNGNNLSLLVPDSVFRADISLSNQALITTSGEGGGAIQVWGKRVTVSEGSKIEANTLGASIGKGLSVNASEVLQVIGESPNGIRSGLFAETFGIGDAGDLTINTRQLQILAGGKISAGTKNAGAAGDLTVNASESVQVAGLTISGEFGSDLFTQSSSSATGEGGKLTINTSRLLVEDGGQVSVSTFGEGVAGNLTVNASESLQLIGIPNNAGLGATGIFAKSSGVGDAGGITINTKQLLIQNGAGITTDNDGRGIGGSITVNASESVQLVGTNILPQSPSDWYPSNISSDAYGRGPAGNITINTNQLLIQDGAAISAETYARGAGGSVTVNASQSVDLIGNATNSNSLFPFPSKMSTASFWTGKAGDLTINTKQLIIRDGQVTANTRVSGSGGSVTVNAPELVHLIDTGANLEVLTGIFTETYGTGEAGNLNIYTGQLLVRDGARVSSGTLVRGNGGNLTVKASESVQLIGTAGGRIPSGLSTGTLGTGNAGNLTITTRQLLVKDGAQVTTGTNNSSSTGNGGNLTVNASESVQLVGGTPEIPSGLSATTDGKGDAGDITVNTKQLLVRDGAQIQTNTDIDSEGDAGKLTVNASELVHLIGRTSDGRFPSGLIASTSGTGNAGDLTIATGQLLIEDGAEASASTSGGAGGKIVVTANTLEAVRGGRLRTTTSGKSDAGNVTLLVQDSLLLAGKESGLFASTEIGSTGKGGSIIIDPRTLTIQNGAKIAVDSQGTGVGGNIDLAAGALTLDNDIISAETRSNTGGDITLNLQELLLLRNGSQISTTAGNNQFGGDGGNIKINTPFIVAVLKENSDIKADAFTGKGGNIHITANGIFGIVPKESAGEFSDIRASSELGVRGEVTINTLDANPASGLIELPSNLVDASQQIASGCTNRVGKTASRFIATGRGGLPLSPNEPLRGRAVITSWVNLPTEEFSDREGGQLSREMIDKIPDTPVTKSKTKILEAQAWIVDANGDVILTDQSPQSSFFVSTNSC